MKYQKTIDALKRNGYRVSFFERKDQATEYILESVRGYTVGFGDSATLMEMKLAERLLEYNEVIDPSGFKNDEFIKMGQRALNAHIFFVSANSISETGEIVNIDSTGNRVAGSLFGHEKVFFVIGTNKIETTLEKAIWRARNVAAPKNAKRFGFNTPCAVKGDRCYDCSSSDRICNAMVIHMKKMKSIEAEVILIDEILGL